MNPNPAYMRFSARRCEDPAITACVSEYEISGNDFLDRNGTSVSADRCSGCETSAELLQLEPSIHEGRTVGKEFETRDDPEEASRGLFDLGLVGPVIPFGLRQIPSDSSKELLGRLDDAALVVLLQVALHEHAQRILGQLPIRLTGHNLDGPRISNLDFFHGETFSRRDGMRRRLGEETIPGGGRRERGHLA